MQRRRFTQTLLASGAAALAAPAWAQAAPPVLGREYVKLDAAQPTHSPGQVEVLEFFSYACPHCHAFEPELQAWAGQLPASVALRRVPVPFLAHAETFQRSYYALEALGLVAPLQGKIFQAVHTERLRLARPEDVAAVLARHGADAARFLALCKSFSVAAACARAKKLTADFGVASFPGVPALAIAGRFITSPAQAGGSRRALAVADHLIQQARA